MGKKEIKKRHKNLDISLIDYLAKFDPTKTNKLTGFLVKMFEKSEREDGKRLTGGWVDDTFKPNGRFEAILAELLTDCLGGRDNINTLQLFAKHLEAGRITENDISKYDSWGDINRSANDAELRFVDKVMRKETKILHDDDTWLIIKPLSLQASQTYGLGTKWCTSMKHEESYFYKYSKEGILIYVINKRNGKKFGFYSSPNEFSVWDAVDRRIDSMETRLPLDLIGLIGHETNIDNTPLNHELFTGQGKEQYDEYYSSREGKKYSIVEMTHEVATESPTEGAPYMTPSDQPIFDGVISNDVIGNDEMGSHEITVGYHHILEDQNPEAIAHTPPTLDGDGDGDWEPRGANVAFGEFHMDPQVALNAMEPMEDLIEESDIDVMVEYGEEEEEMAEQTYTNDTSESDTESRAIQ